MEQNHDHFENQISMEVRVTSTCVYKVTLLHVKTYQKDTLKTADYIIRELIFIAVGTSGHLCA